MMKLRINKWLLVVMGIALSGAATAQQFGYKAVLKNVPQTGFYRLVVTPELSAHIQPDGSDVRIWDQREKPVPYILRQRPPRWQNALFKPFPIMQNRLTDSGNSEIIFEKNGTELLDKFWIIQRNSNVFRQAVLSGSNNRKDWFIVDDAVPVNDRYELLADSNMQPVYVAPSNYQYYKLRIANNRQEPLNIIHVGRYLDQQYAPQLPDIDNPAPGFTQKDSSDGNSYLTVDQAMPYQVGSLGFDVVGQKFVSSHLEIYIATTVGRKQKQEWKQVTSYELSLGTIARATVPLFKAKQFFLVIHNGDDPPLDISAVHTGQPQREIVAWLESGKSYTWMSDAANAQMPHYSLEKFRDSIPAVLPQIALQNAANVSPAATPADTFPRKYIWLIMIGAVALLGLLTWRLTTEMKKPSGGQ